MLLLSFVQINSKFQGQGGFGRLGWGRINKEYQIPLHIIGDTRSGKCLKERK